MSEGTITALVKLNDEPLLSDLREFVTNHTDGVKETELPQNILKLSGSTFDSEIPEIVDGFSAMHLRADFLRIIHTNEYGEERFWITINGATKTFCHDQEDETEDVVLAYKKLHEGLGELWVGAHTKGYIKSLQKTIKARKGSSASSKNTASNFSADMLPNVEKACLRVLQLYLQSSSLADYTRNRGVEDHKLVDDALSDLESEAKRCLDKGRELLEQGFESYTADTVQEYLNERVAAAFSTDREHSESGLAFACKMTASQIEAVIKQLSTMDLWE